MNSRSSSPRPPRSSSPRGLVHAGLFALLFALLRPHAAAASLPAGAPAPPIALDDIRGVRVETAALAPAPLVLIFGDPAHAGVARACREILDALDDHRLDGHRASAILIIAQDSAPPSLHSEAADKDKPGRGEPPPGAKEERRWPARILLDPRREAFGAYRILVQPTVVVIDAKSTVVRSYSGPAWGEGAKESLVEMLVLMAHGADAEEIGRLIVAGASEPAAAAPEAARAERLVHLASELTRHGLYDLAEARYAEATAASPGHLGAMLGLAELQLRRGRGAEAEALFLSILTNNPDAAEAELGLIAVLVSRSADIPAEEAAAALAKAEAGAIEIIARHPDLPRAHYLLGLILEQRGDQARASKEYRKAAEMLLER